MQPSRWGATRIAGIYGILGALWIAVSDRVVAGLVDDTTTLTLIQNYKGWAFILCTSALVFLLTYRALRAQERLLKGLQESESRFRSLFDGSSDALFLHDGTTGAIVDVNRQAVAKYGYDHDALLNMRISDLSAPLPQYDEARARNWLERAMAHETPDFEWLGRHRDGHTFWTGITMQRVDLVGKPHVLVSVRDITAYKQAEQALRESEEKFSRAFHDGVSAMAIISEDNVLLDVNEAMAHLLDFDREELIGQSVETLDLFEGNYASAAYREHVRQEARLHGAVRNSEIQVRTKHGELRHALLSVSMLPLDGKFNRICVLFDITERKKAEDDLVASEARFRTAVSESPFPALIHAEGGEILAMSRSWSILSGYSPEELPNLEAWLKIAYGHRSELVLAGIHELYEMQGSRNEGEFCITCKDGSKRVWDFSSTALGKLPDGRRAVISMAVDITERKRSEVELRESEERYRLLFASNPNPMWVYDLDTLAFLEVNDAAVRHYGYSREEFLSMTIGDIRPPEELPRMYSVLAEDHQTSMAAGVWKHRRKDGKLLDVEVRTHSLRFEGRRARLALANDITDRLQAEAGREIAEVALRQAQKMEVVGRLAGGVAHDFNNMLSVILGYTDQVMQSLPADHELQASLDQIMIAGKRSADLTRQLLTFSRKQVIVPRVVDLNQVLSDHRKMLGRLIGEHIDLRFEPASNLWPVRIDPVQVNQVLANLAVNARDAIGDVGALRIATANVAITEDEIGPLADAAPGEYVLIVVADSGSGMDAETLNQIFEPFFTTKEEGKGTGLGLATVYGIVRQNEGFVRVESTLGKGSTFYVYLPRYRGAEEPKAVTPDNESSRGIETVLIVEDEQLILALSKKALARQGYHVLSADAPLKALRICEEYEGEIDLLLSDLIMPEMNGRELSNRITAARPGIRTIFMSGYTADLIASQGILEPGVDFLQKPFPLETLAAKVREVLDRPR